MLTAQGLLDRIGVNFAAIEANPKPASRATVALFLRRLADAVERQEIEAIMDFDWDGSSNCYAMIKCADGEKTIHFDFLRLSAVVG